MSDLTDKQEAIVEMAAKNPDASHAEIRDLVNENYEVSVSRSYVGGVRRRRSGTIEFRRAEETLEELEEAAENAEAVSDELDEPAVIDAEEVEEHGMPEDTSEETDEEGDVLPEFEELVPDESETEAIDPEDHTADTPPEVGTDRTEMETATHDGITHTVGTPDSSSNDDVEMISEEEESEGLVDRFFKTIGLR